MQKETNDNRGLRVQESNTDNDHLPGYPAYPDSDDIYEKDRKEEGINPEDLFKKKETSGKYKIGGSHQKDLDNELSGYDLDIPGAELDDDMENIGSEDEENNYYSLGGDDHDNLDENQGE
jgi:hypothetical protein